MAFRSGPARLLAGIPLLVLLGCGERADREAPRFADSGDADLLEIWTLSEAPLLHIGVRDGEEAYELHNASGSARLDDGRIVVANGGSQQLRFYDQRGAHLYNVGQDGEGSGELRRPTRVRKAGPDSLLAWDQGLRRISHFTPGGSYLAATRLLPAGPGRPSVPAGAGSPPPGVRTAQE